MEQNELQPQQEEQTIQTHYTNDLNQLTAEIKTYVSVTKQAMLEAAGRLYHAKNHIFKPKGEGRAYRTLISPSGQEFFAWAETEFNFKQSTVQYMIKTYQKFYLDSGAYTNKLTSFNHGTELLSLPEEIWEEEFFTNKTDNDGDHIRKTPLEMSTREIRMLRQEVKEARKQLQQKEGFTEELEKKLREINETKYTAEEKLQEKEKQLRELQAALEAAENQAPAVEIVEKVVEKIVPTVDHETLAKINRELKAKEAELQQLKAEKEQTQQAERDAKALQLKLSQLSLRIKEEETKFDEIGRRTKNLSLLGTYAHDIKELLTNKLAPLSYMPAIREYADSRIVQEDLRTLLLLVQQWHDELLKELDQATYGAATPSKSTKGATITVLNANK